VRELELTLGADGNLRFDGRLEVRGVEGAYYRSRYHADATRRERLASDLAADLGPVELVAGPGGMRVVEIEDVEKPVQLHLSGAASARREGQAMRVPMGPSWALVRSFASRAVRDNDLLLGPRREREETWTLNVPQGMRVLTVPKGTQLRLPFASYDLEVVQEGQKVTVRTKLTIDRARLAAADYPAWRQFCEAVDATAATGVLVGP
jgi:hypothetical protein